MALRAVRKRLATRAVSAFAAACLLAAVATGLAGCGGSKHTASGRSTGDATTLTTPLPGTGRPPVAVGDKNTFPEQFVLGALYEQALAAQGYSVSLNRNIGPTGVTIRALEDGSLSFYPEYLRVWDRSVAGYRRTFRNARQAYDAGARYAQTHGFALLKPTPFADTDALAVTLTYAVENGLSAIGDLRKVAAKLTVGGPPEFENSQTGLAGVEQVYGFAPAAFKAIPFGEQYQSLDKGTVQAADVNTTDGQLASDTYALLSDTSHVFGFGNVVPVATQKAIEQEGPAFAYTINAVSALLTTPVMRQLNAAVALDGQNPTTVAKQFLEAHRLIPSSH